MATQTLEFNAGTGLTISCKLFAVGSDTVVATATATEKTNDDNRYAVEFTDVAAGAYRLNGFVSSVGGFANEIYDLTLETATFYPRSEAKMRGTDASLLAANYTAPANSDITAIKAKTDQLAFTVANQVDANALTGGGGLDAAGVRSAIGLASANLDTQIADLPTVAEFEARSIPSADYFVVGDYTAPLDASGVRSAVGLATANLDTQLAELPKVSEFNARTLVAADYFVVSDYTTPPTVSQVADEVQTRTIARVTLVDTCTTNTDMRGTDSAALAATALSTATWTGTLATNLGTTNTTVATNLDATVSSRLALASYTAPLTSEQTQTAAAAALTAYDPPTRTEATADKDAVLSAISGAKSTPDKIAVRSIDDTTPVRFAWPTSGETITVERSLNNAAYEAATGTVSFFRTEGTEHWYTLSYNAADRAVGVVRYRLTDGTITRYVTLRVELPTLTATQVRGAIGLATANLDTQLADLPTVAEFEARTIVAADYFVVGDYTAPANSDITSIKTKTDQLTFTVANQVDSNALSGGGSGLDASGIRAAVGLASANLDTQLADLPTVAEFEARTIVAADYFVVGDYTAPPTASANASQVRTELTTELGRIDTTVSSRSTLTAANVWEHATRSLTTFGTLVSDIWSAGTRTLTAISDSSGITTLLGRILGTLAAGTHEPQTGDSFARLGAPAGASIAADIAAIEGGLTGDYTLTVTITDATDDEPIEAATVTLFRSGERGVEPTDNEGEAIFGVDAATWSYVVRAAGYESATGTKVIAANDTLAVELTPIVVNQAAAPACNVVLPVIDQYLAPAAEVLVCIEFLSFLPNATKTAVIVNHPPSLLSDANGQVEVTLARLAKYRATYQVRNESPKRVEFSTPNAGSFIVVEA
jgi:hypothetical protein